MPRCLDPGATFDLWCESDADKPKETRPTFVFRVLSLREWRQVYETKEGTFVDAITATLRKGLVGWRNLTLPSGEEVPYVNEDLDKVLDQLEAVELFEKLAVSASDKKKLESQPTSNAESSAEVAAAESA